MNPANLTRGFAVLFGLALAFTLVMALLPKPPAVPLPGGDKIQHMAAFAALSLLARLAYPRQRAIALFAAMAVLGALIEVLQMIPALHRDAQVGDWIADCVSSLVALLLCEGVCWVWAIVRGPAIE